MASDDWAITEPLDHISGGMRLSKTEYFLGTMVRPGRFLTSTTQRSVCLCQDCFSQRDIWFVVHDSLWSDVVPEDGIICMSCFERRMGRPLRPLDLRTDATMNHPILAGWRMARKCLAEFVPRSERVLT